MTLTNMTSPSVTANAILAEESTGEMALLDSNSTKPTRSQPSPAQISRAQTSDGDDQRWDAIVGRDSSRDGEFVFAVSSTGVYCRPRSLSGNPQSDSAKEICRYIEQHLDEPITLDRLGKVFRKSPFHLQRRFKAALGITPREYADSCRLRLLKRNLQAGDDVTRAMYDAGYGSSSRLYEKTASQLGMTPDKYRRGAIAATVRYTIADSPLGRMLVGATDKGVCAIQFAHSDGELIEGLKREFRFAARKPDEGGLQAWVETLLSTMTGHELNAALPLDIRATAFQRRVWTYLQSIPFGSTKSYGQVAKAIGQPSASRAVARACATNPVAVAIPCHRVVREDGSISGYRWGVERKKALLELEQG